MVQNFPHELNCPGGGFGRPGGGFFSTGTSSGFATASTCSTTTPRTTKTTTGTSSWAKFDTNYFWTGTLIKCPDYSCSLTNQRIHSRTPGSTNSLFSDFFRKLS